MSTDNLLRPHTLPRTSRETTSQPHEIFSNKLTCILCNTSLDNKTHEHKCVLRPKNKDVIISK
jgi:hypothetical protein